MGGEVGTCVVCSPRELEPLRCLEPLGRKEKKKKKKKEDP